jgi:hypothetical protein
MNSDNSATRIVVRDYVQGETFIASRSNIWEAMNNVDPFFCATPCWAEQNITRGKMDENLADDDDISLMEAI